MVCSRVRVLTDALFVCMTCFNTACSWFVHFSHRFSVLLTASEVGGNDALPLSTSSQVEPARDCCRARVSCEGWYRVVVVVVEKGGNEGFGAVENKKENVNQIKDLRRGFILRGLYLEQAFVYRSQHQ